MAKNKCYESAPVIGLTVGFWSGIAGIVVGAPGGPALQVLLGLGFAMAGYLVGLGVTAFICWLMETFGSGGSGKSKWDYAIPSFSKLELKANPNPAIKDSPCTIAVYTKMIGNSDNAVCKISYVIEAEEGDPASGNPSWSTTSSSHGRHSPSFTTKWSEEHDGRTVSAKVSLEAEKNNKKYGPITEIVNPIVVPVLKNP